MNYEDCSKFESNSSVSSPVATGFVDRPLSPVLSAGKLTKRGYLKSKQGKHKSKKDLSEKFTFEISRNVTEAVLRNTENTTSNVSTSGSGREECIKLAEEIRSKREEFHNLLSSINGSQGKSNSAIKRSHSSKSTYLSTPDECFSKIEIRSNTQNDCLVNSSPGRAELKLPFKDININIVISKSPKSSGEGVCTSLTEGEFDYELSDSQINHLVDDIEVASLKKQCTDAVDLLGAKKTGVCCLNKDETFAKAFETVGQLNSSCKHCLSAIHLVEKSSDHSGPKENSELKKKDMEVCFSNVKFDGCFVGFSKEEQIKSQSIADRNLVIFECLSKLDAEQANFKKSIFSVSNGKVTSENACANMGDGLSAVLMAQLPNMDDALLAIIQNKKRAQKDSASPPSKRHKISVSPKKRSCNTRKHTNVENKEPPAALSIGFQTASGNPISASGDAVKKAERMFDDKLPTDEATKKLFAELASTDTQANDVIKEALITNRKTEEDNQTCNPEINFSSKQTEEEKQVDSAKHDLTKPTFGLNLPVGFKRASGANIALSRTALQKAYNMFSEIAAETKDSSPEADSMINDVESLLFPNGKPSSENFKHPKYAFKPVTRTNTRTDVSNTDGAQKLFVDGLFKPKSVVSNYEVTSESEASVRENFQTSKTTFSGFSSVGVSSSDIPSRRKTLGSKVRSQIAVPEFKVQEAMSLFENIVSKQVNKQTLMKSSPVKEQHIVIKNKLDEFSPKMMMHPRTRGGPEEWLRNVEEECTLLKKKLEVLSLRKQALEQQTLLLQTKSTQRQAPGVLYLKKTVKNRISLRKWVQNMKPRYTIKDTNVNLQIITPQNAAIVHFNVNSEEVAVIHTEDAANVIPNIDNNIGLSEIEYAFKAMNGVVPTFLPRGWIENHYKWIVWKLAGMERMFPLHFGGVLCVENIIQQLKYRYDREIDRAERPAIRKILEKDDAPEKRMILCVSNIIKTTKDAFDLELCDGWYSVRTSIDTPLCEAVKREKIVIGTKLVIHNAKLVNCEGCYPLQASESVRLKICYNCTRRAAWDAKLGFQKHQGPFTISLNSVHGKGGVIGCVKVYVARVYPVRYMEKQEGEIVWRNERAERRRALQWDRDRNARIEKMQEQIEKDLKTALLVKSLCENAPEDISEITYPNPNNHSCKNKESLSESQKHSLLNHSRKVSQEYQDVLSKRLTESVEKAGLMKRNVTSVFKFTVVDATVYSEQGITFNVWNPTNEILELIKENTVLSIYNAIPKSEGLLSTDSKTKFKKEKDNLPKYEKMKRTILPIATTIDRITTPYFNEFDTIGIVIKTEIHSIVQKLWLTDLNFRLLLVSVSGDADHCLLFNDLERGQTVLVSNLILCEPKNGCGFALANQHTLIATNPSNTALKDALQNFVKKTPQDLEPLLTECEKRVDFCMKSFKNNEDRLNEILNMKTGDDYSSLLPTEMTAIDVAISLINTDQL